MSNNGRGSSASGLGEQAASLDQRGAGLAGSGWRRLSAAGMLENLRGTIRLEALGIAPDSDKLLEH